MGSGEKFKCEWLGGHHGVGLGIWIDTFPHQLSINITLIKLRIYIGFGKGYDEV